MKKEFFMKNKILDKIRKIDISIFILLIVVILIRTLIYTGYTDYSTFHDTTSYMEYKANILKGEIDAFRTPIYPNILNIIEFFNKDEVATYKSVTFFQEIISIISVVILYNTLKKCFKNQATIWITTLIYACLPAIFTYNRVILTESLSISLFVMYFCFIIRYLLKPTNIKTIVIGIFTLFLIMLRPSFIYLIILLAILFGLIFILKKENRTQAILGIGTLVSLIILVLGYCFLNKVQNNFWGISNVTQKNQLDIVIGMELYDTRDSRDKEIIDIIEQKLDKYSKIWFRNTTDRIMEKYTQDEIGEYLKRCLKNNFSDYFRLTLKKIFNIALLNCDAIYLEAISKSAIHTLIPFIFIYLYIIIEVIYIIIQIIRKNKLPLEQSIMIIMILGQLATIILGAQAEYSRLFIVSLPIIIISIGYHIEELITWYKFEKR